MTDYKIVIENCNSIDRAEICIKKNSLNIKFGPNGLGKSTIAKAIVSQARDDGTLAELIPFKSRGDQNAPQPKVEGVQSLKSAMVFDEEFVDQFVFQQDEVVKNSFEIFIKTPEYDAAMEGIETQFAGIKKAFDDNPDIEQATKDLKELRDAFGKSKKDGAVSKNSKVLKAFGDGNNIDNIPEALKPFELFIKGDDPSNWIGWQVKGNDYLALGDTCPYCSTELPEEEQKATALAVDKEYNATVVKHLNTLKAIIGRLGKYFSAACQQNLETITKAKLELTIAQKSFLGDLKNNLEVLIKQLEGLRSISFFSLRNVDAVEEELKGLTIDLKMIDKLDSTETRKICNPINSQLDALSQQVSALKGQIGKQNHKIEKTIRENQDSINGFLKSAGYKYSVKIIPEADSYKMKLVHEDSSDFIDTASNHLSYGEKNAFALVLFMHQVLSEKPDIIILDDPISSFDKNKKFAILDQLFRGKGRLKGKTTLMLTHDLEPAIDIVRSTAKAFQSANPSATFLSCKQGVVKETAITRADIRTFSNICLDILDGKGSDVIKAIYLRRHYEILDNFGIEYNLLASLFKKRLIPTMMINGKSHDMTSQQKTEAEANVKAHIQTFDYQALVAQVSDIELMKKQYDGTEVGYEKIQLFRIIHGSHPDNIITKFINETYHIENEYVMQLNPSKFESVPEYVIEECSKLLQTASSDVQLMQNVN